MTYEIKVYETIQDFNKRIYLLWDDGLTNKREAIKTAKKVYKRGKYAAVKVQSEDREFIQIYPAVFAKN